MEKTLAYLRASTDKQETNNQKLEVLEFARKKDLKIDDFIELTMSSQKPSKQRRIDELINRLNPSDTLIVTELSRLGRSTAAVISLINTLVENNVRVVILKQQLDIHQHDMNSKIIITMFSLFGELERDLVSLRTKEALAAKKSQGQTLGKPKGTIQRSKFDQHIEQIKALLEIGLSVRKIAKVLGYNHHIALNTYINKRQIRSLKVGAKPLKTL
ncbi:resolvase [Crenothrix sp. D3]|nr:resolvase [Crenothrix sp. D3]